jgi:hypothetical protein
MHGRALFSFRLLFTYDVVDLDALDSRSFGSFRNAVDPFLGYRATNVNMQWSIILQVMQDFAELLLRYAFFVEEYLRIACFPGPHGDERRLGFLMRSLGPLLGLTSFPTGHLLCQVPYGSAFLGISEFSPQPGGQHQDLGQIRATGRPFPDFPTLLVPASFEHDFTRTNGPREQFGRIGPFTLFEGGLCHSHHFKLVKGNFSLGLGTLFFGLPLLTFSADDPFDLPFWTSLFAFDVLHLNSLDAHVSRSLRNVMDQFLGYRATDVNL